MRCRGFPARARAIRGSTRSGGPNGLGAGLGQGEVLDLAFLDEGLDGAGLDAVGAAVEALGGDDGLAAEWGEGFAEELLIAAGASAVSKKVFVGGGAVSRFSGVLA